MWSGMEHTYWHRALNMHVQVHLLIYMYWISHHPTGCIGHSAVTISKGWEPSLVRAHSANHMLDFDIPRVNFPLGAKHSYDINGFSVYLVFDIIYPAYFKWHKEGFWSGKKITLVYNPDFDITDLDITRVDCNTFCCLSYSQCLGYNDNLLTETLTHILTYFWYDGCFIF